MNSLFPRASLKRSPHIRTRKNSISADTDIAYAHSHSSVLARRKTRPPPLQIIPELSENELSIDIHSPATARPTQFVLQQPELDSTRITLSAYTFSIDDALLMFGHDAPRSPALSASSTTDGASSEGIPATPGTSDDEEGYGFMLPTPRLRPQRISIRPLCITKTRSLICNEEEDIHSCLERDEEDAIPLPVMEEQPERTTEVQVGTELAEEPEQDFYTREFENFITLSPVTHFPSSPARRDSLTLVEALPTVIDVLGPKPLGRSRHSKPLPLLPPVTPVTSFPSIPTFSLVQTTAQTSIVRRKRNIPPLSSHPPPPPPVESRPLPRTSVPLDIEDCIFSEENFDDPSSGPIVIEQVYDAEEGANIYSRPSFTYSASTNTRPLPPAILETPLYGLYGEVALSRSSTDSDAPRSSVDSTSSFASSMSSNALVSPSPVPSSPSCEDYEPESTQRLCSRWSSSTLASLATEPSRTTILLSPIRSVLNSRARRVAPQKVPPPTASHLSPSKPKNKRGFPTISPPSTPGKHIRRQGSRSSTSSAGTSSSECNGHDGSPSGLKRKPIPLLMFLRAN